MKCSKHILAQLKISILKVQIYQIKLFSSENPLETYLCISWIAFQNHFLKLALHEENEGLPFQ